MLSKVKFIIIFIVVMSVIAVSLYFILSKDKKRLSFNNKTNNLVICNSNKEGEVSQLRQEGGIIKDIDDHKSVLVGFYTNRSAYHLRGPARNIAERLGWNDFIDGFAPPTPLLFDTPQTFQDGELIEIEVKDYETVETGETSPWGSMDVIRVSRARKFSLLSRQDFIQRAEIAFTANAKSIFQCADSKPAAFNSFESGIERTVVWDRLNNQALITYGGAKEFHGATKIVDVSILLDQFGTPVTIFVGSKVAPLDL